MNLLRKIIHVSYCLTLCLGLQSAWAADSSAPYRFQGMLPPTQLWDFDTPTSIASAPDGSVWIADPGAKRIQHVYADGSLIAQFNIGEYLNFFSHQTDIALAPDGSVWLATDDRITHFSATGKLLKAFGSERDSGIKQFNYPNIAIAQDSSVWVANGGGNTLQHFTAEGELIAQVNSPACFGCVINIALATDGSLWVASSYIYHYATDGQLIAILPVNLNAIHPVDIAVAGNDSIWVLDIVDKNDSYYFRLRHLYTDGRLIAELEEGQSYDGLAIATDGSVWLVSGLFKFTATIRHLRTDGSVITQFGWNGEAGQISEPAHLAIAPDNSIWVYSIYRGLLQHFDASGGFIAETKNDARAFASCYSALASKGSQAEFYGFPNPYARVSLDIFRPNNAFSPQVQAMLKKVPENSYGWQMVTSINIAADSSLWVVTRNAANIDVIGAVADPGNDYFWHLNTEGNSVLGKIKGSGGIAPQADGSVWIANAEFNRIQHFAADGRLLSQFGSRGTGPGQFKNPQDIAVDADGNIIVADTDNHRIQKFTPSTHHNSPAEYDDQNGLLYLDDVAVDGTHYQATLQLQHGAYRLLTQLPTLAAFSPSGSFNSTTNLLSIPLARAFGQDYQAQFKYLGDSLFELTTATPLKP